MSIQTDGRYELIEMHLMDANTREEDPLCKATVEAPDLISVQDHLERRMNDLPVPTVLRSLQGCRRTLGREPMP